MLSYKLRENKGITLVALIITMIVLIILLSVVLGNVTGKESVITKTKEVRNFEKQTVNQVIENKESLQKQYNDMMSGTGSVAE